MTRLLIFVLALLLSSGCAKQEESADAPKVSQFEAERAELTARIKSKSRALVQPAAKTAARPGEGQGKGVEFSVVDKGYTYDATGKRDPFRSFILTVEAERKDARGPLEQFDLTQLKLVAVVWGSERARAVVADPSGRGYIVREGTLMGKNEGRIVSIADNALVVKESYVDYFGETTTKDVTMRVRAEKEGDLR
jgi:type IV pilus assembly protein PilP